MKHAHVMLIAFLVIGMCLTPTFADLQILVLGSDRAYQDYDTRPAEEDAFTPGNIASNLQNMLVADPAVPGSPSVVVQSISTNTVVTTQVGQPPTTLDIEYRVYTLAQYYYWPDQRTHRQDLLTQGWDYVVLMDDPFVLSRLPGFHEEGVRLIGDLVRSGGSQPLLLMPWPSTNSTATIELFGEMTYRVGDGCGVPVIPAGYAWARATTNYPALIDLSPEHPTPHGAYLAAAGIYSQIFNRSATNSSYLPTGWTLTDRNLLADLAVSTMLEEGTNTHYIGSLTNNPICFGDLKKRTVRFNEEGTSTEIRIRQALDDVLPRTGVVSVGYPGFLTWPGLIDRVDFQEGRMGVRSYANPDRYDFAVGFPLQDYQGDLTMRYGIDARDAAQSLVDVSSAKTRLSDAQEGGRVSPHKLLWSTLYDVSNAIRLHADNWHLSSPMNNASAAFMVTMLTGRCPVGDEPVDHDGDAWQDWAGRKVGYETAWRMCTLADGVPGFEVLPSSATSTEITSNAPNETLSVRFLYAPTATVHVTVSLNVSNTVSLVPQQLTFTPANYASNQTVSLQWLNGPAGYNPFLEVHFCTMSDDPTFDHVTDRWDYTVVRSPPVANAGPDQTVEDADNSGSAQVVLDGSESSDLDGPIVGYAWAIDGADLVTGENPMIDLSVAIHNIALTVTDADGLTAEDSVRVIVTRSNNQYPVADAGEDFVVEDSDGDGRELVTFDGSGSYDVDGGIVSYSWLTNSVEIATGITPSAQFPVGLHNVELIVTDDASYPFTGSDSVMVHVAPPPESVPFTETFETNPVTMSGQLGSLNGQRTWRSTVATVQTSAVHSGSQAMVLSRGRATLHLTNSADTLSMDLYLRGTSHETPSASQVFEELSAESPAPSVAMWIDGANRLNAYDGGAIRALADVPISTSQWVRCTAVLHYNKRTWDLWLDGTNVIGGFGFFSPSNTTLQAFAFQGGSSDLFIDDIRVAEATPTDLDMDADGDGIDDVWERTYFSNSVLVANAVSDFDQDSYIDLYEFGAGTDPLDRESLLTFTGIAPVAPQFLVLSFKAGVDRDYTIRSNTNLLDETAWQPMGSGTVIHVTDPVNLYTVDVDRAEQMFFQLVPTPR